MRNELSRVIQTYEKLRIENDFTPDVRRPFPELGSHWRLLPPNGDDGRYDRFRHDIFGVPMFRPVMPEAAVWSVGNDLGEQPLRVRSKPCRPGIVWIAAECGPSRISSGWPSRPWPRRQRSCASRGPVKFTRRGNGSSTALCLVPIPKRTFRPSSPGTARTLGLTIRRYPTPLDLRRHRALGLWVNGDGQGEVLNVQLEVSPQSYLHFYLPIDFSGWKYCELGEPEGDRVMDYFADEKFALHDLPLDRFIAVTLMILNPPAGKQVDLRLGRIEALQELGGELAEPTIQFGDPRFTCL